MNPHDHEPDNKHYWLDQPKNVSKLVYALAIACAASVLADFIWHRHGHFDFEEFTGFYAIYGFIAYCFIVLTAKQLRGILKRDEDYYD